MNKALSLAVLLSGGLLFPIGIQAQDASVPVLSEDSVARELEAEEVVITGYGSSIRSSHLTSSIATVHEEDLKVGTFSDAAATLSGKVSGLKVVQSGNPSKSPSITLRGGTDWDGSGSPLYVIDGQLRDDMSGLNPDDIERIDILKDASATALYGARANNGVVLVTTRRGHEGHSETGLRARVGWQWLNRTYDMLSAPEFIYYMRRGLSGYADTYLTAAAAAGTGNTYGGNSLWNIMGLTDENKYLLEQGWEQMADPLDPSQTIIYKATDISAYTYRSPALQQDYSAYLSGGNSRGNYYFGAGFNNTQGLPVNVYNKRYSLQFNADYKLNRIVTSQTNFSYTRNNWRDVTGYTNEYNYFVRTLAMAPTARFEDEEGNLLVGATQNDGNQMAQADQLQYRNQNDQFSLNEGLNFQLAPGLTLKTTAAWYYVNTENATFFRDYQTSTGNYNRTRQSTEKWNRNFSQTYNATLNYRLETDNHSLTVMAGGEYYQREKHGFSASGSGAPTDDFADLELTDNDAGRRAIDSWNEDYRILSGFARLNYALMGRYLISFVAREDGYSSLLDNRWGFFPGVSGGWVFSQEEFARDLDWLTYGKLRLGYGINGNATGIGAYDLQGKYTAVAYAGNTGFALTTLPNPSLLWEKTKTTEAGLDLTLLNSRLKVSGTFYNRLTSDKYASQVLPESTGYSSLKTNNGQLRNRGMEVDLTATVLQAGDFRWDLGVNLAYNKNIVVSLPDNGLENNRQGATELYTGNGTETYWAGGYQEGQEPGAIIGYHYKGVYTSEDQIPEGLLYNNSFTNQEPFRPEVGDAIWEDRNGDNVIDAKDRYILGYNTPHWTGGLNTSLSWKGISLHALFDYAMDYVQYDAALAMLTMSCNPSLNLPTLVRDTYSEENTTAAYPRFVYWDPGRHDNYYRVSDIFTRKADYLMLRELNLSYQMPARVNEWLHCQDLTVSLTGQNLLWWTATTTTTPESQTAATFNSSTSGGYSLPRTLTAGVSLKF